LAQASNNFMQIKVMALGHRKKLLSRLSLRAPLDSSTKFYYSFKVNGWFLANLIRSYFWRCSLLDKQHSCAGVPVSIDFIVCCFVQGLGSLTKCSPSHVSQVLHNLKEFLLSPSPAITKLHKLNPENYFIHSATVISRKQLHLLKLLSVSSAVDISFIVNLSG